MIDVDEKNEDEDEKGEETEEEEEEDEEEEDKEETEEEEEEEEEDGVKTRTMTHLMKKTEESEEMVYTSEGARVRDAVKGKHWQWKDWAKKKK
eukprot:evm.model.NODE_25855_length_27968_cov_19.710848.3